MPLRYLFTEVHEIRTLRRSVRRVDVHGGPSVGQYLDETRHSTLEWLRQIRNRFALREATLRCGIRHPVAVTRVHRLQLDCYPLGSVPHR